RARLGDPFQPRGDVDAVAHQVAVALLDHVAEMNADAKFDAALLWYARIALDHGVLHLDRAAHRVNHAAKLDNATVARALDDAAVVDSNCGINQIAAQRPQPRQDAILVRSREPAVADHVGDQDRRDLPRSRHSGPSGAMQDTTESRQSRRLLEESDRGRSRPPLTG